VINEIGDVYEKSGALSLQVGKPGLERVTVLAEGVVLYNQKVVETLDVHVDSILPHLCRIAYSVGVVKLVLPRRGQVIASMLTTQRNELSQFGVFQDVSVACCHMTEFVVKEFTVLEGAAGTWTLSDRLNLC
jgi:hypothetical protein